MSWINGSYTFNTNCVIGFHIQDAPDIKKYRWNIDQGKSRLVAILDSKWGFDTHTDLPDNMLDIYYGEHGECDSMKNEILRNLTEADETIHMGELHSNIRRATRKT